jgi:hypothetical protein
MLLPSFAIIFASRLDLPGCPDVDWIPLWVGNLSNCSSEGDPISRECICTDGKARCQYSSWPVAPEIKCQGLPEGDCSLDWILADFCTQMRNGNNHNIPTPAIVGIFVSAALLALLILGSWYCGCCGICCRCCGRSFDEMDGILSDSNEFYRPQEGPKIYAVHVLPPGCTMNVEEPAKT